MTRLRATAISIAACVLLCSAYALRSMAANDSLDVTKPMVLTKRQGDLKFNNDETSRQQDTLLYYTATPEGRGTIASSLATLAAFRNAYHFAQNEKVTYYYNRGDLGIGREMHCADNSLVGDGTIACYVRNFASGDDKSDGVHSPATATGEFSFGLSPSIAFANMATNHPFATVAMAYRPNYPPEQRVIFAVYGQDEKLQQLAALDRVGNLYVNGVDRTSTPGVNFNNHIPSNCLTCHGGAYRSDTHSVDVRNGPALFLPFDLDQFEYEDVPGRRRSDQEAAFKTMNEMVWKVYTLTTLDIPARTSVGHQLDIWYGNTQYQTPVQAERFEGEFNSSAVPSDCGSGAKPCVTWNDNASTRSVYSSVVRASCRNCHMTNRIYSFDNASLFNLEFQGSTGASDLCGYVMPHALQTLREFWLSSRASELEGYLRSSNLTAAANQLAACGPGNVATLDPPLIAVLL